MSHTNSTEAENLLRLNRRQFLNRAGAGVGGAALAGLLGGTAQASTGTHFPAKAKRIIYLFQSGGPAQQELFDYKPLLNKMHGQELPSEVRGEQRLTGMSANQSSLPIAGSNFKFDQYGDSGAWLSELLPYHREIVDDICFLKGVWTKEINHDPAITMFQTGSQLAGRPSLGSWLSYGLGSENENLPAFVVLATKGKGGQPLYARLWGSGFLDSRYQGVRFRAGKEPVLYLSNPDGACRTQLRKQLDAVALLNEHQYEKEYDPEIQSRIAQYEMAYRMQTSVPGVTDLSDEPESTFQLYGEDARTPGTFAANCLLARRMAEKGVRFVQLYHQGWDQHGRLPAGIKGQARDTDQASAALVKDLKDRGMLDDTLVIWGGEFGRTSYSQGLLTPEGYGRDHHPGCFTMWMAGGGIKPGVTHGETDPYSYNSVGIDVESGKVHVHDVHATILHLMGIDHERLTFKHQGRRFRLTDVHGELIEPILA